MIIGKCLKALVLSLHKRKHFLSQIPLRLLWRRPLTETWKALWWDSSLEVKSSGSQFMFDAPWRNQNIVILYSVSYYNKSVVK